MENPMTAAELARRCKKLAEEYKTLYILGCFGAPMTAQNRTRYTQNQSYNRQPERAQKISAAREDTFGFDCVCMIKGILWGWQGDSSRTYGGAVYGSNQVPDLGADAMFGKCTEQSEDFSCLEVGEAVWMQGHIGIYIGDGLAVEATPLWKDGVQITACNCKRKGYPARNWEKHGKLPYVRYDGYGLARFRQEVTMVTEGKPLPVCSTLGMWVHILICLAQKRLDTLGFSAGEADGVFGPMTQAAVLAYQQSRGLPMTGKLDSRTWNGLMEWEENYE